MLWRKALPARPQSNLRAYRLLEPGWSIISDLGEQYSPPVAIALELEPVTHSPGVIGDVLTRIDDFPYGGSVDWLPAPGGGGNLPEAPTDGQHYTRRGSDASWQPELSSGIPPNLTVDSLTADAINVHRHC